MPLLLTTHWKTLKPGMMVYWLTDIKTHLILEWQRTHYMISTFGYVTGLSLTVRTVIRYSTKAIILNSMTRLVLHKCKT